MDINLDRYKMYLFIQIIIEIRMTKINGGVISGQVRAEGEKQQRQHEASSPA